MCGPLGDLGRVNAAVKPRRQTGMSKVVRPPGDGRGLRSCRQRRLACLGPRTPVGNGGKLAAAHTAEQAAIRCSTELREVIAQDPGQLGVGRHDPAVALGAVLELPPLASASVIGPVAADVGSGSAQMQFAPLVVILFCVPRLLRQEDVVRMQLLASSGRSAAWYMIAKKATSRGPLGCWARTASSSARACGGFTTLRRSTWLDTFGAVHLSARIGFDSSRPTSTALRASRVMPCGHP